MVRRSVVTALCVLFLFSLVACGPKANESNPARGAYNRAILEKCRNSNSCSGGFAIQRSTDRIWRIVGGDKTEFATIGIDLLMFSSTENLGRFEFVLPGDRPKWDEVAVAYSLQFTPIPAPH